MAKLPWLKLYTELLDDPKLALFTGDQFRVFIMLLCLAREAEEPGYIQLTPAEISWRIRRPVEEIESTIELCLKGDRPIMTVADGGYIMEKFLDRQYEKPSDMPEATRQRKQKQRDNIKRHAEVTPSHAIDKSRVDKIRVDKDTDKEKKKNDHNNNAPQKIRPEIPINEDGHAGDVFVQKPGGPNVFRQYQESIKDDLKPNGKQGAGEGL